MVLSEYLKNVDNAPSSEFQKVLSTTEKIICQHLKRVVIRGKRGRGAPVLFDKKSQEAFDVLIRLRDNFGLQDNLYLFRVPDSQNSVQGYIVVRKHAKIALGDPNKAAMLTSTRPRKHLGTTANFSHGKKMTMSSYPLLWDTKKTPIWIGIVFQTMYTKLPRLANY